MYKLLEDQSGVYGAVKTNNDGSATSFLFNPANTDYQEFLRWCSEGNEPLPADEVSDA